MITYHMILWPYHYLLATATWSNVTRTFVGLPFTCFLNYIRPYSMKKICQAFILFQVQSVTYHLILWSLITCFLIFTTVFLETTYSETNFCSAVIISHFSLFLLTWFDDTFLLDYLVLLLPDHKTYKILRINKKYYLRFKDLVFFIVKQHISLKIERFLCPTLYMYLIV